MQGAYDRQRLYPDGKVYTSKYDLLFEGKQLYYAPCIGVKTGYTNSAGRCFVGAAEQNGVTLVSVSLNTSKDDTTYSQVFTDTIRLCNYGFAQYREVSFREMFAMCDDSQLAFLVSKAAKDDAEQGLSEDERSRIFPTTTASPTSKRLGGRELPEGAGQIRWPSGWNLSLPRRWLPPSARATFWAWRAIRPSPARCWRAKSWPPARGDGAAHDGRAAGRMGG